MKDDPVGFDRMNHAERIDFVRRVFPAIGMLGDIEKNMALRNVDSRACVRRQPLDDYQGQ